MGRDGDYEHRVIRQVLFGPHHCGVRAGDLGRGALVGEVARASRDRLNHKAMERSINH